MTFAIKGGQAAVRCERSFAYPVGGACTARVCVFVYICVQGSVYSWWTVFFSFSEASDLLEEKAGGRKKKMKGRETFLSVSHLSCDARWVLFLWLFRKAGGGGGGRIKKTTQREGAE